MFELAEELSELISQEVPHASRRVYIGVSHEISHSFVVEVMSHFLKKYNDKLKPKVMMVSDSHDRLIEKLRFREIDLLVSQNSSIHHELIDLHKVEAPVNLVFKAKKVNMRKLKNKNFSHLIKEIYGNHPPRWVVPSSRLKLRSEINQFFERYLIKGDIVFESDVMESISRSVSDEIGISFMPLIYIPKEINDKSIQTFGPKKGYWKHNIWISTHKKNQDDYLINSFSDSFKDVCKPILKSTI